MTAEAWSGETFGCMIDWTHNLGYYRYSFRLQKYDLDTLLQQSGMRCSYDRKGQPMSENDFIIVDEEETNKEDNKQDTGEK